VTDESIDIKVLTDLKTRFFAANAGEGQALALRWRDGMFGEP